MLLQKKKENCNLMKSKKAFTKVMNVSITLDFEQLLKAQNVGASDHLDSICEEWKQRTVLIQRHDDFIERQFLVYL
jgi:hypothetical protein